MNNHGSAVVFTLVLMPALLAIACAVVGAALMLFANRINHATCRREMIRAQEEVATPLNNLLAMNAEAQFLHRAYEAAKKSAENPAGAVALAALLVKITAFRVEQLLLIGKMNVQPNMRLMRLDSSIQEQLAASNLPSKVVRGYPWGLAPVALRSIPLDELLSTYETRPNFEHLQMRSFRWQMSLDQLLPRSFHFLWKTPPQITGACAGTLTAKKGQPWKPVLSPAKY